jgi:O-antigen ligase
MALVLLVVLLVLHYVTPYEVSPALASMRIIAWLTPLSALLAVIYLLANPVLLRTKQIFLLIGFLIVACVSRAATGWFGSVPDVVLNFGFLVTVFCLALVGLNTFNKLSWLNVMLLAVAAYYVAACHLAYHAGYRSEEFLISEGVGQDPLSGEYAKFIFRARGLGVLNDPNDLAQQLLVVMTLQFIAWRKGAPLYNLFRVLLPCAALVYGIALTQSRGGITGGVVVLLTLLWTRYRGRGAVAGVGISALLVAVVSAYSARSLISGGSSAKGRLDAWGAAIGMFKMSPLWGIGYGFFGEHHELTAHNSFALCLAELGLLGYFCWVGLLVLSFRCLNPLIQLMPATPLQQQLRRWSTMVRAAMVAFLSTAWFLSRTYMVTLYLLMGISAALYWMAVENGIKVEEPRRPWWVVTIIAQVCFLAAIYVMIRLKIGL